MTMFTRLVAMAGDSEWEWTASHGVACALVGGAALLALARRRLRPRADAAAVEIVETSEQCARAVAAIRSRLSASSSSSSARRALGFDCEWVHRNGERHPVALLQLASADGHCALVRLCKIQYAPPELRALLEDPAVLKVGVSPHEDAKHLRADYAVRVAGVVDLRHLASLVGDEPESLAKMAARHLNVTMDKDWHVRCSNWEATALTARQRKYAAADALCAIGIFEKIVDRILGSDTFAGRLRWIGKDRWAEVERVCAQFVDLKYRAKHTFAAKNFTRTFFDNFNDLLSDQQRSGRSGTKPPHRNYTRMTTNKIPYQNCYMQTAEGETLCTCEKKKAEWYVQKGLADFVNDEPFTIQLRFEPAGKPVGDVGRFYRMPRANKCVVCGQIHSYIRKNVVPKEYRRLFPTVMKDHSSHDVLLLCLDCHQISNIKDQSLRLNLAETCDAPIGNLKLIENFDMKQVKSAARALLLASSKHAIPEERKSELESVLRTFYPDQDDLTEDFLRNCCNVTTSFENPSYHSHGEKVVEHFKTNSGGLLKLESMWRDHFIETMRPRFMPELWSTTHTQARLEIRAIEGRVNDEDLLVAGLNVDTVRDHRNSTSA